MSAIVQVPLRKRQLLSNNHRPRSPRASSQPWVRGISNALLFLYLIVIGAISAYDMLLTIRYAESLRQLEMNPIGRWLMQLDQLPKGSIPDVTLFLIAKGLGTLIVLSVIFFMTQRRAHLGHPVGLGVSACQLMLVFYLCYGTIE